MKKIDLNAKLTDQSFIKLMCIYICCIVLCMAGLGAGTWAWFNAGVTSGANTISAAYCSIGITVDDASGNRMMLTDETMNAVSARLEAGEWKGAK